MLGTEGFADFCKEINTIRMNWGKSIVLVFVLFAGFIGGMVFWMTRQRVDLVREDYYQNEMEYQQQIDRLSNTAKLTTSLDMTYEPNQQKVAFVLPQALRKGEITFYRPADRQQDFRVRIPAEHPNRKVISTARMAKGYWKVQFSWSDGRQEFFSEKELFIQ